MKHYRSWVVPFGSFALAVLLSVFSGAPGSLMGVRAATSHTGTHDEGCAWTFQIETGWRHAQASSFISTNPQETLVSLNRWTGNAIQAFTFPTGIPNYPWPAIRFKEWKYKLQAEALSSSKGEAAIRTTWNEVTKLRGVLTSTVQFTADSSAGTPDCSRRVFAKYRGKGRVEVGASTNVTGTSAKSEAIATGNLKGDFQYSLNPVQKLTAAERKGIEVSVDFGQDIGGLGVSVGVQNDKTQSPPINLEGSDDGQRTPTVRNRWESSTHMDLETSAGGFTKTPAEANASAFVDHKIESYKAKCGVMDGEVLIAKPGCDLEVDVKVTGSSDRTLFEFTTNKGTFLVLLVVNPVPGDTTEDNDIDSLRRPDPKHRAAVSITENGSINVSVNNDIGNVHQVKGKLVP